MLIQDLMRTTNYTCAELRECLNIKTSTYYYKKQNSRLVKYEEIKSQIIEIFQKSKGKYGYPRVLIALQQLGYIINHKTVYKLMKELDLIGFRCRKTKKYNSYKGEVGKTAPNIINRNFKAEHPYEKMFTDVTEFKIGEQKVYLSPMIDGYNSEVIAYQISTHGDLKLVQEMMDKVYKIVPKTKYTKYIHSDQGFQYQHISFVNGLKEHNIVQSMSRKGNCNDNGIAEAFFGRLKTEFFYQEDFENVTDFVNRLEEYIYYYNNERIKTALRMSSVEYRLLNAA